MAHYAFLNDKNIVVKVLTGIDETETIEGLEPEVWYGQFHNMVCKRTSYNTFMGKHYSQETGKWSKARQFRGNYAGVGYEYRKDLDAFIPPKPFDSWSLNTDTFNWDPPVPRPDDGNEYHWDESIKSWVLNDQNDSGSV